MTQDVDGYRAHSQWTDPGRWAPLVAELPPDPARLPGELSGFLLHPFIAPMRGERVPEAAANDQDIRSVEAMLDRLQARVPGALATARAAPDRLFCVCAGFARIATAVFRAHGLPARCRSGFATYFAAGNLEDHWVCEYWTGAGWRLLDAQLDPASVRDLGLDFAPWDVPRDRFLDGSTAWRRMRAGELDASRMGLSPLGLAGAWFVVGNLMLDVAALNKEELLPWEKWSIGRECGPDRDLAPEWNARLDEVAGLLGGAPDAALAERVYRERAWLRVTPTVLSFASGAPVEIALAS